jgi:CBS domain-containing protein
MRISDVLKDKRHKLVTVSASTPIAQAVSRMRDERVGALIVSTGNGRLIGVLSERDIVLGLHAHGAAVLDMGVDDVMTLGVPTASPSEGITETMKVMTERRARHVPVIEDDIVVGLVSIGDITKYRLAEKTEENGVLQDLARFRLASAA